MADPVTWIDIATLGAASVAATAPIVRFWEIYRGGREDLTLHIGWRDFGPNHPIGEAPFLYITNNGSKPVMVTDIRYATGLIKRKLRAFTALDYADPLDLNFPYEIGANETTALEISDYQFRRYYFPQVWRNRISSVLRRSSGWIRVQTAKGTIAWLGAEDALPWSSRPAWRKIEESRA